MTWYAVRTAPGSQMPQREYHVQSTALLKNGHPRGKGYRIVPSLDPRMSAVELALNRTGFDCYMPPKSGSLGTGGKPICGHRAGSP